MLATKINSHRDYKHFSNKSFRCESMTLLCNENLSNEMSNGNFIEIVDDVLLRHLSLKYKYIKANDIPFMDTEAVMLRSKLRNRFYKHKTASSKVAYKKQRNIFTNLFRKAIIVI